MKALVITEDRFPNGNAGAVRQEQLSKILISIGYDVKLIGLGAYSDKKFRNYKGIKYISLRSNDGNRILRRLFDRMLFSRRVIKLIKNESYDIILFSSIPNKIIRYLKRIKKSNPNCKLVYDSVEWYSASEFRLGVLSPQYIKKNRLNTKTIDKSISVISISSFLNNYYKSKGLKGARIPFIVDTSEISFCDVKKDYSGIIHFVYAGMIGRKDHLLNFFEALSMLDENSLNKIRIDVFGCSYDYLAKTGNINKDIHKKLMKVLQIHDRVDRDKVLTFLHGASFSLLFRDASERYAKAGFPTKVVESLACFTPVFCNLSSDLEIYLKDNYNCIVCKDETTEEILKCLKRIIKLDANKVYQMKLNSRKTAEKYFDYNLYIPLFKELLEEKC